MTPAPRPTPLAPLRGKTIGIVGAGTMGQALIKGLLAHGVPRRALVAADSSAPACARARRAFRIAVAGDARECLRRCDVLILAVKPQQFPELIAAIAPSLTRRHLVISIAAGMTLRWLQSRLRGVPVIRVMPNLPATVGCAFSAIVAGRGASARDRAMARAVFGAVGEAAEVPERFFDAITAVSGSGPAYVFFLVRAWEDAARSLGLPPPIAASAVAQTLAGSVRLLQASGQPASALIGRVASKGGTTEAALQVLARHRVSSKLAQALKAAARRSRELACS